MEGQQAKTEIYRPKVVLKLSRSRQAVESIDLVSRNTLYVRRRFGGRGGVLLDCSDVQLNDNSSLHAQLEDMYLIDELFTGINHSFVIAGGTYTQRRLALLGDKQECGVLMQFVQGLFSEINSSYRINSAVKCSFFEYAHEQFWDLLAMEPTPMPLDKSEHCLRNMTQIKVQDVCNFMVYLRIALRSQLTREHAQPSDLLVRINVTGFDEFTGKYYESTVHFVEYNQPKNLKLSLTEAKDFSAYFHPYSLHNCKLLVVYCTTDAHYQLLEQISDIQQVLTLRRLQVECHNILKQDSEQRYVAKFRSLAEEFQISRLVGNKHTLKDFIQYYGRQPLQKRKFIEWTEQALEWCEKQLKTQARTVMEYRRTAEKVLNQRYCEEMHSVEGQHIGLLWRQPIAKLHDYLNGQLYYLIKSKQEELWRECSEKIMNVRSFVKIEQEARPVCTAILQSLVIVLDNWWKLFLQMNCHEFTDKYCNQKCISKEFSWLYERLRQLRGICNRATRDQADPEQKVLPLVLPRHPRADSSIPQPNNHTTTTKRTRFKSEQENFCGRIASKASTIDTTAPTPVTLGQLRKQFERLRLPRF